MRIAHGLVLFSVLGFGCGGTSGSGDAASSQDALDTTDVSSGEAAVLTAGVDVPTSSITADAIATDLAAGWAAKFTPTGCATSTASGSTVTLVLAGCTGPYGLVSASGTVALDIGASAGGYTAHATSTGLKFNKATADIDAMATFTSTGGTKMLTVTDSGSATGPRGNTLTRTGSYTATWGSGCLALDGTWTTTVDAAKYTLDVSSYSVCEGACPAAGGSVTWTGPARTLDITFDGSADASYSEAGPHGGAEGTVALFCTAS
jgi:hypothetical protein